MKKQSSPNIEEKLEKLCATELLHSFPQTLNHKLLTYEKRFYEEMRLDALGPAKITAFQKMVQNSQLVLVGDFHSHPSSLELLLSLARVRAKQNKELIIALEAFFPCDNQALTDYLAYKIDEKSLLRKTRFSVKWGFNQKGYLKALEFARKTKIKLIGINSDGSTLSLRDKKIAGEINLHLKLNPNAQVIALLGDFHLAQQGVLRYLNPNNVKTRVFCNLEPVYFQYKTKFASHTNKTEIKPKKIYCLDSQTFCVLDSPPWQKWQSYLFWLDENFKGQTSFDKRKFIATRNQILTL